jgi:integral membrane sensor domain MASE1
MRKFIVPLLVALAYAAAAELGFTLAFATKQVTAVWPPTGIAIAALLLWGSRVWPGIWIGAFATNALSGEPIWAAAGIATGNTLAPLLGSVLLRRFRFRESLERVRDVLLLAAFGSAIPMTVSATNGVGQLALARIVPWSAFGSVWWVWWAGDAMGVLFVAPLLLTWLTSTRRPQRVEGGAIELAAVAVAMVALSWVSFASTIPLRFSVYPPVIWIALRFRQRETAAAIALVSGLAIWATSHGLGPWTSGSLDSRLVQVDSWMAILGITGLIMGAVTAERRAAGLKLQTLLEATRRSAATLQTALLPQTLPERAGLQCDALYIAAEREALIGGDWYDAFELPDGSIVFTIGDVTGHGLDAAVAGARIRGSIFAAAFAAADPAAMLAWAGQTLQLPHDAPATALVAVISPDLSTMRFASAGHPPPYVASPSSAAHALAYGGLPLGYGLPIDLETHTVSLESGAVVLLYTDGLTEFSRDVESTEPQVLQAMTHLLNDATIEHPARYIQQRVMGAERPADDTVLVVLRLSLRAAAAIP